MSERKSFDIGRLHLSRRWVAGITGALVFAMAGCAEPRDEGVAGGGQATTGTGGSTGAGGNGYFTPTPTPSPTATGTGILTLAYITPFENRLSIDDRNDPADFAATTDLQILLNALGCGPLEIDKHFGPATESSVMRFQRNKGFDDEGVVGPVTLGGMLADKTAGNQACGA